MDFNPRTEWREEIRNQPAIMNNGVMFSIRRKKKNWNKLVLNYPNQTLAIAEKLRTDNVQLMVQSKKWWWIQNLQWRAIQYQSSTDLSIFCLLQISVPTNGDDAMSDMENFSTPSSIISQIENGPDKLINNKRLLCNQILGFFSSVDENRTKDEPIDFAMDTTWGTNCNGMLLDKPQLQKYRTSYSFRKVLYIALFIALFYKDLLLFCNSLSSYWL